MCAASWRSFSQVPWWGALSRFPELGELTLRENATLRRVAFERADHDQRLQARTIPRSVHTLTIEQLSPPMDGAAAFANDLPTLTKLTLEHREPIISRWLDIAPLSLTHIALHVADWGFMEGLSRELGRFPCLQRLRLSGGFALVTLIPFLRSSDLRHIELQYTTFSGVASDSNVLLDLIQGPDRIGHLQEMHVSAEPHRFGTEDDQKYKRNLQDTISGAHTYCTSVMDLKRHYNPFRGSDCTARHIHRFVHAARSNGINIAGSALRCLDWEQHFDDLVECCFVEHALSTNDFTILDREYGKEGADEAIRRQRPHLAARLSASSS